MPLNIEVETDTPEVAALKKRVIVVTNKYTRTHGWCHEANNALREMGVLDSPKNNIRVAITFTVAGGEEQHAIKVFNAVDLIDKSEDEQKEFVASQIAPDARIAGVKIDVPITVIDLNNTEATGLNDGLDYPEGFQHFYTSAEGRVAHLTRLGSLHSRIVWAIENGLDPSEVEAAMRQGHVNALCGYSSPYSARLHSARSEHRICAKCLERTGA